MVGDDGDLLYVTVGRCLLSEDFEKEMKAATREKIAEKKKKGRENIRKGRNLTQMRMKIQKKMNPQSLRRGTGGQEAWRKGCKTCRKKW